MRAFLSRIPLRWRVFAATSISITALFGAAGLFLQQYALSAADESVRAEMNASVRAYEAVWKTRTQILLSTTALMSAMSDVRAAFMTRDQETIRDSAQELWSRVSDQSAMFLVLTPEGTLIASLGNSSDRLDTSAIPIQQALARFPRQLSGYVQQGPRLFQIVLTPVYVQTSRDPVLLNVLCAGFRIDDRIASELKALAPGSEFAFVSGEHIFASTLGLLVDGSILKSAASSAKPQGLAQDRFVTFHRGLSDVTGRPVANLVILRSYERARASLANVRHLLITAWLLTIVVALLISLYVTRHLLRPVNLLDRAAAEISRRNYSYRVPVKGNDELSRLAATFNQMCDSIEQARAELICQEQIQTVGRLSTSLVHDLRNPLAAIYGGAEMLIDGQLPAEHTARIASNIYRASQRVQQLLTDLLNVSRGQSRDAEEFPLREAVEAAASGAIPPGSAVGVEITLDDSVQVFCDRSRVERVFSNLFSNAVEAVGGRGEIKVYANSTPVALEVYVEDSGSGVPVDIREQLFRPFTTGKRSGLGLGLTLSRQTMIDLGGDLRLLENKGTGACFCVIFANSVRDSSSAARSKNQSSDPSNADSNRDTNTRKSNMAEEAEGQPHSVEQAWALQHTDDRIRSAE